MLKILEERRFEADSVRALASPNSAGKRLPFKGDELEVETLTEDVFQELDLALFSAGGGISKEFAPLAAEAGCVVVDNSSAWRMDPGVPLVVPEVNASDLEWHKNIVANPNCSTIQMVVVLNPLHQAATIKRVVVATYQAVSGSGQKAVDELESQVRALFNMEQVECNAYPYQIAFNCLPHIGDFLDNDYTQEEMKMVNETKKILADESIGITATTVRVPVFYGHSEAVNLETESPLTAKEARGILSEAPGVVVWDNPAEKIYPMALEATGQDGTYVGRIRRDISADNGLDMWIVADNIRKGAALNTVQIAEELVQKRLLQR
jgi:aspartate-semialdehyde dehydrogenase